MQGCKYDLSVASRETSPRADRSDVHRTYSVFRVEGLGVRVGGF